MKNKAIITMSAVTLAIVLAVGISFAWFTNQVKALPASIEAGSVKVLLKSTSDTKDNIIPAEEGKTIDYTITNSSSGEVIVQFKAGALTAYVMPKSYLDKNGYISKDKHKIMKALSTDQKMNVKGAVSAFVKLNNVPAKDVTYGRTGGWIFTGKDSEYLGMDIAGNQYLRIQKGGDAKGMFTVALTEEAGNRYQYGLFTIGEAVAFATQNSDASIAAAFNNLDIKDLTK